MAFWPYTVDTYQLFRILLENPRIRKTQISKKFKVNPKTGEGWLNAAIQKRIIVPPVFRRDSYLNFREYFYFLQSDDPHKLYKHFQNDRRVTYFTVQSGFANFQIISKEPLELEEPVILQGPRSDYFVSVPPQTTYESAIARMQRKLETIDELADSLKNEPSPLVYHDTMFPWDDANEKIYLQFCNDYRKHLAKVLRNTGTYKDKIMNWIRTKEQFGDVIVMYFPRGEDHYLLSIYSIETNLDSLIIDLFSMFPVSTVFYRVKDTLMVCAYLPFYPSPEGRYTVNEVLSTLKEKELVRKYTNSIVQYHYRSV